MTAFNKTVKVRRQTDEYTGKVGLVPVSVREILTAPGVFSLDEVYIALCAAAVDLDNRVTHLESRRLEGDTGAPPDAL
jgi:hypothetical protein